MTIKVAIQVVMDITVITVDKVFYFTSYFFLKPQIKTLPAQKKNRKTQIEKPK